jgi:hypothetical protein
VAAVSDVAILKRLRRAEVWLHALCLKLCATMPAPGVLAQSRYRLLAVDATCPSAIPPVAGPGSMASCSSACWWKRWPHPLFSPEPVAARSLFDVRWALVEYLLKDIIRAIDPSPGLESSLRDLRTIQKKLTPSPRKRRSAGEKMMKFRSSPSYVSAYALKGGPISNSIDQAARG